jgi:hypothetical protein
MHLPEPPGVLDEHGRLHRIDARMPLHKLAVERIRGGRDLKIIITAQNSETGVGKTTLAGWLALTWTKQFTGREWFCDPENPTQGMATLNPKEYFEIIKQVGTQWDAGTTVIVDDAEELDARRSMQNLNVEFSQRWMLMRLKQAITVITLPSPSAIDSRLEELADVWINVLRRGRGQVHDLRVQDYGSRNVLTEREHLIEWPDISSHPELKKLRRMKEDKMDAWEEDEEEEDEEADITAQAIYASKVRDEHDCSWTDVPDIAEELDGGVELTYSGDYLRRQANEVLAHA